jgi:hypothetical protein
MHDRQKISNVKIAIKFGFFVSSQRACFRPVGQFHASAINLPEIGWIADSAPCPQALTD